MPLTRDSTKLHEALCQIQPVFGRPWLVTLPLECRPRTIALVGYALGMSLLAILVLFVLAGSLLDPAGERARDLLNFAVLGPFAVLFARRGYYAWRGLHARSATLVLDADGFEDQRLQLRVAWRQIAHARIKGEQVRIWPKKSPGMEGERRPARRADQVVISLAFLSSAGAAANIMGRMIEKAGGEVDWR